MTNTDHTPTVPSGRRSDDRELRPAALLYQESTAHRGWCDFSWLDGIAYTDSKAGLLAHLPRACWAPYRSPISGVGEVETLRSWLGNPADGGGELHVTFLDEEHVATVEVQLPFGCREQLVENLERVKEHLAVIAGEIGSPVHETVDREADELLEYSWWASERSHYELIGQVHFALDEHRHFAHDNFTITVRKFPLPIEPDSRVDDSAAFDNFGAELTMEEVLMSIREVISEDDAPDAPDSATGQRQTRGVG